MTNKRSQRFSRVIGFQCLLGIETLLHGLMVNIERQTQNVFFFGDVVIEVAYSHIRRPGYLPHGRLVISFFDK